MKRLAVLISGRGSNLKALLDAQQRRVLGGQIVCVVANRADAAGLQHARAAGIPTRVVPHVDHSRAEHEHQLLLALEPQALDLVCLAGYMRILSAHFIDALGLPILNVHPSLLPAFPGREAQRQALEWGVAVSGATVHLVTAEPDGGPIVMQGAVDVLPDDDERSLSDRILAVEHALYPEAVARILAGRWKIQARRIVWPQTASRPDRTAKPLPSG